MTVHEQQKQLLADPLQTLSRLPAHTQRLILAQSMLTQQQQHLQLVQQRHWEHARWQAGQAEQARRLHESEQVERAHKDKEQKEEEQKEEKRKHEEYWRLHTPAGKEAGDVGRTGTGGWSQRGPHREGVSLRADGMVDLTPVRT
jgi:hypothetical protein